MAASEGARDRPPAGSLSIDKTPWSGDHREIKEGVGASATDKVLIDRDDNVWLENPDGTFTNYGPASSYTGSGSPTGRSGKDRSRR